ncbi:unnamed protein product [Rotaria sp. Silwood1]|nr:unnamed protein product [Rotaria sp. Silwood1]CAF1390251.1 unnamed protein product [Rotaria sp. Silwood1]
MSTNDRYAASLFHNYLFLARRDSRPATANNNANANTASASIPAISIVEPPTLLSSELSTVSQSASDPQIRETTLSETSTMPKSAADSQAPPPVQPSSIAKSAWGPPILPPAETSTVPKLTSGPQVPPSSQSYATPKSAWGPRVSSPSEPAVVSKPIPGPQAQPPSQSSAVPKSAWGPRVPPSADTSTVPKLTSDPQMLPSSQPSALSKPVWGPPSRNSHPTERSSSAFPMMNEENRSSSVNKATALSKEPRSQSVLSARRRRFLCSAVPDSAVLSPVRRPDDGGSSGEKISVYTNHFPVHIDNVTVNQYDIEIFTFGRDGKLCVARKDERWETMQCIANKMTNFPIVWYDEGKTLYTRALLTDFTEPIQIKLKRGDETKTFQLNILNLVRQEKISNIFDFIQKKTILRPRETVRIIETLFKQRARNDLVCVRNQFYNRNQILDDLKDGRGMAKGFYQALFLTRCGPTLNINLTFTCFYMPLNFVHFACKYLRKDITNGFTEYEAKAFAKIVRDLLIETEHTGRIIRYKLRRFGLPADQLLFTCGEVDENLADTSSVQKISVAEYFEQKYQRKLLYPHLPCIDATAGINKRANWLPMEVVKVVEWQRSLKPLDATQRALVSGKAIIKPFERYNHIMNIMRTRDFETDIYLKELNIRVDNREMLEIRARILKPPSIHYGTRPGQNEAIEHVNVGKWRIRNWFYTAPDIHNWGLIYFGCQPNQRIHDILNAFSRQLPELLKLKGFMIKSKLTITMKPDRQQDIEKALTDASKNRWQLAIVVLNTRSDQVYDYVKQLGNQQLGLRTQCIDMEALTKNIDNLKMYVDNLSQKINSKLGGINSVVNTKLTLSHSSKEDLFMFFGADVTHSTCSTDRPSIAAVVASRDPTNSLYAARLCEQYPKKGRCSMEIIKELDQMVADLIRVFARTCGGRLPNKIVFYRDGVDEGQYQKVLDNEVNKIKTACRIVYGDRPLPKLTFIVVKKRHNTRFFLYDGKQTMNVQAGTVIDQDITHPSQFDFYLCSQAAIMGTSRPTLYHVLHDDNCFSSDDVQQLTYWLCHTDMRCTKSVSIPSPVHYAHLAAYGSRALKFDDDRESDNFDDNNDEEPASYSIDDIKTKLMILDSKVVDDMWFI